MAQTQYGLKYGHLAITPIAWNPIPKYGAGPPLVAITASSLLERLSTRFWSVFVTICANQNSLSMGLRSRVHFGTSPHQICQTPSLLNFINLSEISLYVVAVTLY